MSPLRVGVCLLPELSWAADQSRWREAEQAGFSTIWTYDHLSWRSLRDGPWYAAIPLLTAAAGVTSTARLGLLVASPNFRHPVPFAKELMTLDRISAGRLDIGLGAGTPAYDATVLGQPTLTPAERMTRLEDFVTVLDACLSQPATTMSTASFEVIDARMIPGCVQQPRAPFTIAATGRRGLALAARRATTWVTYGPAGGVDDEPTWWDAVLRQRDDLEAACDAAGRNSADVARMALVSLETAWQQASPDTWDGFVGRLGAEGFTDVVIHWPRPDDPSLAGPPPATFAHIVESLTGL